MKITSDFQMSGPDEGPSVDDDLYGLARSNAELALFECRLASDALDRASNVSSHRQCLRELEVATKAVVMAVRVHDTAKDEDESAAYLGEALVAVFWKARELANDYQRLDEDDDDAARWLQELATERALIGIVLAIARALPFPHPEAVSMAKSLIELGWWVSSASGDSHWRIGRKKLSNKAQLAELAIREQSIALTMDIYRAVCELKRQLPERGSEPPQEVA